MSDARTHCLGNGLEVLAGWGLRDELKYYLRDLRGRFAHLKYAKDAVEHTVALMKAIRAFERTAKKNADMLTDVWYAVDERQSNDIGDDRLQEFL